MSDAVTINQHDVREICIKCLTKKACDLYGCSQWRSYRGQGGQLLRSVGFCYDQSEIYKSVIFRNRPILDNKSFLSLMCICCFITISEVNLQKINKNNKKEYL